MALWLHGAQPVPTNTHPALDALRFEQRPFHQNLQAVSTRLR